MSFYSKEELATLGFSRFGTDVHISRKVSIYNPENISIGNHVRIDDFCVLSGCISIGRNVHIAVHCNMAGGEKGIVMEDFSGLAYSVNVFTQSDDYTGKCMTNPTVPVKYKDEKKEPVYIKRHTIVGAGSMVFPGVVLGEGTSVGAMSMVSRNTEPWTVYFGIPAKPLKRRKKDLLKLENAYIAKEYGEGNDSI